MIEVNQQTEIKLSKKAGAAVDRMIRKFETGDLSKVVQIVNFDVPDDAPSKNWSLSNRLLAFAMTGDLDSRGYKQWQVAGRQVMKGPKSTGFIFRPRMKKSIDKEGNEEYRLTGFVPYAVFGGSETEGDDELQNCTPHELPPLANVAEHFDIDVTYMPLLDRRGSCSIAGDKIQLGTDNPKTWFHELSHAIHAQIDEGLNISTKAAYAYNETVSEFTACVLMDIYGYGDYSGNAWHYIGSYHADPLKAVMAAFKKIEAVMVLIEEIANKVVH